MFKLLKLLIFNELYNTYYLYYSAVFKAASIPFFLVKVMLMRTVRNSQVLVYFCGHK